MDVCRVYQRTYSEFLSWDEDDRHKAVMHEMRRSERCPGCGTHPDEWDPRRGGDPRGWRSEVVTCDPCAVKAAGEKELDRKRETGEFHVPAGTRVRLVRAGPPAEEGGDG